MSKDDGYDFGLYPTRWSDVGDSCGVCQKGIVYEYQ